MKHLRIALVVLIALSAITSVTSFTATTTAQGQTSALERGYRTGYSDGYNAGFRDISDHAPRDYQNKPEYQRADRNYNQAWGTVEDYRDGYQQGFEVGYSAGFERNAFNSSIPNGLTRRGVVEPAAATTDNSANSSSADPSVNPPSQSTGQPLVIQRDQMLLIELQSSLSTDASQEGDRFQARVVDPRDLEGAIIEGRVVRVKRAGKLKGSSELQLGFESIRLPNSNSSNGMSAQVVEVVNMGQPNGEESGTVDSEGGVRGRDSTKDDVTKVGAATGIGAIIGAIAGGGKGAAIGAAIGGSIGTAGVLSSRGKDLRLAQGQQLRIRSANEVRIQ